jgi:Flp pilus assembly protein CpaB
MRRGRILILLALILLLGAVAAFLILTRLPGVTGGGPAAQATEGPGFGGEAQIVIAAQDIARGAVIPSDGVILSPFPADFVVETMITDLNQVVGKRARMEIARGVPVTERMITEQAGDLLGTGSEASIAIPPGMTAVSVPLDRFSGVAYAVADGDAVDVVISLLMVDIDPEFQTLLPDTTAIFVGQTGEVLSANGATNVDTGAEGTSASSPEPLPLGRIDTEETTGQQVYLLPVGDQRPRLVTQRLISNATVLHVGEFSLTEEEPAPQATEQPAGAPVQQQQAQQAAQEPQAPDIVTLIVQPQDALALKWALRAGADLTLTLRAPGDDTEIDTTSVTLQFLLDNYDISVPSKVPYGLEPRLEADARKWVPSQETGTSAPVTE